MRTQPLAATGDLHGDSPVHQRSTGSAPAMSSVEGTTVSAPGPLGSVDTAPRSTWLRKLGHAYGARWARDSGYLILASAWWLLMGGVLWSALGAAIPLVVVLIGVPMIAVTIAVCRWLAQLSRSVNAWYTKATAQRPSYVEAAPGSTLWQQLRVFFTAPRTWMDLGACLIPAATALVAVTVFGFGWVTIVIGLYGLGMLSLRPEKLEGHHLAITNHGLDLKTPLELNGTVPPSAGEVVYSTIDAVPAVWTMVIGAVLVALLAAPWVTRFLCWMHLKVSSFFLNWTPENETEVAKVQRARAQARAVQSEQRLRLERDIHDGPQQNLIRLGMDLGRVKVHLQSDPTKAATILDESIDRTSNIIDELRNLSRGIAPPILVDRGLKAAIAELANRSTIPVTTEIDLPDALPFYATETIYFVVAEALSNAAKHSGATSITVEVTHDSDTATLRARVGDNGTGGACASKGSGLAGLERRATAADATLTVRSPEGGPTMIEVEVPCES